MEVIQVEKGKKKHLDLPPPASEQEDMVDRYLERGNMSMLTNDTARAKCVVTKKSLSIYELKSIATVPQLHRQGYSRRLIEYVFTYYSDLRTLYVGIGDSPLSLGLYHARGFIDSHWMERFFTDNCNHSIIGGGVQLVDMVYLKRERDTA